MKSRLPQTRLWKRPPRRVRSSPGPLRRGTSGISSGQSPLTPFPRITLGCRSRQRRWRTRSTKSSKAFLAGPEGTGPLPGIVVIQEWWGLTDWVKDNAKRLAAQGYVALAPDLYRGKVTTDPMVARQLLSGLPQDRALRDLKAAVD